MYEPHGNHNLKTYNIYTKKEKERNPNILLRKSSNFKGRNEKNRKLREKKKQKRIIKYTYVLINKNNKICTYISIITLLFFLKIWNASWICVSSLCRGHANLLCIIPILVYVLPKRALNNHFKWQLTLWSRQKI